MQPGTTDRVFNVLGSKQDWKVVDFCKPSCSCKDWLLYNLPCKHLFAVFSLHPEWDWDKLPGAYQNQPRLMLNLDVCLPSAQAQSPQPCNDCDAGNEIALKTVDFSATNDIPKHEVKYM